ncbi:UNVERIFIED_CONTAM: hypothetical protein OHV15_06210 [Microbacterium sp. SLM126]
MIITTPLREVPAWAILERRLFETIETAWPRFVERYCEPDGRLRFSAGFGGSRDGVDDFYEPFFNWPTFYSLGGSSAILDAAKHHWEGVTAQLAEAGMLTDEFENGYDWFHIGESLVFFYALCAADPGDSKFAERARRFAELYSDPGHGNYDAERNIIVAPHTGALGPRDGLGPEWQAYSATQDHMRPYGLPLEYMDGIRDWADLVDDGNAHRMGQEMQRRATGDVVISLASTSLVANRWLYDSDDASLRWVERYLKGWADRAASNGGLVPDSAGADGTAGGMHDRRWHGGHYGWTWPHGLLSVGAATLIGALNSQLLDAGDEALDLIRTILDTVIEHGIRGSVAETPMSLRDNWMSRLGDDAANDALLVPYRFGKDGWFDFGPMPLDLPTWLWWCTREDADWRRLRLVMERYPEHLTDVKPFRDKGEAGHELPWLSYLAGENPHYPERALSMAFGQVARRLALIDTLNPDPATIHIHFWQQVNPVVTEVLGQLISGTPQVVYNGGLPFAAVAYEDVDAGRPGLPPDVAALVTRLGHDEVEVTVVNTSPIESRRVRIFASRFGERRIARVISRGEGDGDYPGSVWAYTSVPGATREATTETPEGSVLVELPPSHRTDLTLVTAPGTELPRHRCHTS